MFSIKQPNRIVIGNGSAHNFQYPKNSLLITSKGAKSRGWIEYLDLDKNVTIYDQVENNPSMDTVKKILKEFSNSNFSCIIGLGGGSCLDVAKYLGYELKKNKILIPTTFGSGSEVTRIAVLKINGKKQSFHDDRLIADIAIVDPYFIEGTTMEVIKNSAIDSCAQCSEAYDSKLGNPYTKFLCNTAFDILEYAILNDKFEKLALGSLLTGLGFGNSSTTLGHALSYVYSNEGIMHGHALSFTTLVAHKFNNSVFYKRFESIVKKLNFKKISLNLDLNMASELILEDKKHLDNNPTPITKNEIISLLKEINSNH